MVAMEQKNGHFENQIHAVSIIAVEMVHYRSRQDGEKLVPICAAYVSACTHAFPCAQAQILQGGI